MGEGFTCDNAAFGWNLYRRSLITATISDI